MAEPRKRGFAAMTPEMRQRLARLGGIAAHQQGVGHQFTSEEAREAGRKGGASLKRALRRKVAA